MNSSKTERQYSLLTLRPHSQSSRVAFENFRRKDVVFMFKLQVPLQLVTALCLIGLFLLEEELRYGGRLVYGTTVILLNLVGLSLRNKPIFFFFLPLYTTLYYAASTYFTMSQGTQEMKKDVAL